MAPLDWMTDPAFRSRIEDVVRTTAGQQGMREYETEIVTRLESFLVQNRQKRLGEEVRKAATMQRTSADALRSVAVLLNDACRYATEDKRTTVRVGDLQKAYVANYCQVWPFC